MRYITLATWRVHNASEKGTKSQVAHKWAGERHNPCCRGGSATIQNGGSNPWRLTKGHGGCTILAVRGVRYASKRGTKWEVGEVGWVATYHRPHGGSPTLPSKERNHRWTTSGPGRYLTPPNWVVPSASEWGTQSSGTHKCGAGQHNLLPPKGSPTLHSKGQNPRCVIKGRVAT